MSDIDILFEKNRQWAEAIKESDPDFFLQLSKQQNPDYLWIGCSDSRVPSNQITGLLPGDIFVHRNIANVVALSDINCLSVIQYAVEALGIKHIIVCGHYGCGGVKAAMEKKDHGLIDKWLEHIRKVYLKHRDEIDSIGDEPLKINRLCELNVAEQVRHVCSTDIVRKAWDSGKELAVHGWIYGLENGILHDLGISKTSPSGV